MEVLFVPSLYTFKTSPPKYKARIVMGADISGDCCQRFVNRLVPSARCQEA